MKKWYETAWRDTPGNEMDDKLQYIIDKLWSMVDVGYIEMEEFECQEFSCAHRLIHALGVKITPCYWKDVTDDYHFAKEFSMVCNNST